MTLAPAESPPADVRSGSDYAELSRIVRAHGLLDRRLLAYAVRAAVTLSFYVATWIAATWTGDSWWQTAVAIALGIASTQVAFLGHDAGHQQIFQKRRSNDVFGQVLGDLLVGLSYGWWVGKHNRHHANPNKQDHDPDIGDGVLAFTTEQVAARIGWVGRMVVRRQAWLFFPLLTLEGLNLHVASVLSLRRGGERSSRGGSRALEAFLLTVHVAAYVSAVLLIMSPMKAVVFIGIHQAIWGLYMGCSFAPNHKGMPIIASDADIDYLRRQVLTSRNVRGGWFVDQLLGGLNYQIEHHLFPNMPRASLRRAHPIVRSYCSSLGVPFCETSLFGSYRLALGHLNALGEPLRNGPSSVGSLQ